MVLGSAGSGTRFWHLLASLAGMQVTKGLKLNPSSSELTRVRQVPRVSLSVTGQPPVPGDVEPIPRLRRKIYRCSQHYKAVTSVIPTLQKSKLSLGLMELAPGPTTTPHSLVLVNLNLSVPVPSTGRGPDRSGLGSWLGHSLTLRRRCPHPSNHYLLSAPGRGVGTGSSERTQPPGKANAKQKQTVNKIPKT